MLADGDEDLSSHVTALLGARGLVLNVDTSCTLLNEELGELHDGGQTTVTGVGIGNDGTEVVDIGELGALRGGGRQTLVTLFAVVEKLGHEKVLHLVGHSGVRVVCKIRAGLVGGRGGRGALPSGHIDGVEVLCHLGDHDGIETAVGVAHILVLKAG